MKSSALSTGLRGIAVPQRRVLRARPNRSVLAPVRAVAQRPLSEETSQVAGLERLLQRSSSEPQRAAALAHAAAISGKAATASPPRPAHLLHLAAQHVERSWHAINPLGGFQPLRGPDDDDSEGSTTESDDDSAIASTSAPAEKWTATRHRELSAKRMTLPAPLQALLDAVPARVRGLVLLNVLVVLVATNWVVLKDAGTHFDPFMFASLRFGVAAVALSPFLLKVRPDTIPAGIELGIYTAAGYLAQSEGLLTTDASRASFLSTFTVLVVPFLAGITGRGVRPLTWAAAVAALLGVSLLEQSGAEPCMGDVWSVASAVAFGVQIFRTEHYSRILGRKQTVPLMSVVLVTTAAISGVLTAATSPAAAMTLITDPATAIAAAAAAHIPWREVMYTGILTTDVALLMELVALRDVASTEAAIVYTLEPVLGAGLAFALLGERWGPTGWAGASLIVASCLAMQLWGGSEEDADAAAVESSAD